MKIFTSATIKLAGWYLLILMVVSLLFSSIIFQVARSEVDAQIHKIIIQRGNDFPSIDLSERMDISTRNLLISLGYINLIVLLAGGACSYLLARITLRPIETAHKAQSRFVSNASHQLRTPLAIMRGELEAVEDGLQPLDQRVVQSLQSEVGILSKLVDDIHMLSMTEVAPLAYHWEQVDVVELLDATLSSWQERLAVRGLSLKRVGVIDRMLVSGDPNRLRQVFQNLLENAVRYVDQGGTVQVGCQAGSPGVIIDFDDSGPGMPPEDYPRLFDRFYRREASRNRATGGSGLGLAICRGIVEAHGGRIMAQASPLGGLRVRIELPPEHSSEGNG